LDVAGEDCRVHVAQRGHAGALDARDHFDMVCAALSQADYTHMDRIVRADHSARSLGSRDGERGKRTTNRAQTLQKASTIDGVMTAMQEFTSSN
jgi:hypothetical protein